MQFGLTKHEQIFSKTKKNAQPRGASAIFGLWKNLKVLIYSKLHSKSCDYVLIIYMKKYEIGYHYYAGAKRAHLNPASEIVRSVKTTTYYQNNNSTMIFSHL